MGKSRFVTITEFKAKSAAILDEIETDGNTITITRRGRPLAVLTPAPKRSRKRWKSSMGILAGKIREVGDIVNYSMWESAHER